MKETLRSEYRRKAASPGFGPVLDAGDGDGRKNRYLDFVHRRALRRVLPLLGPRAADLGCGIGRLTALVAEDRFAVGVDGSPDLLAIASGHAEVPFVRADTTALPLASGSFTGALMAFVSMHFDDETAARSFAEVARILAPGGHFVFVEHLAPDAEDREYRGVLDRARGSVERLMTAAGLEPVAFAPLKKSPSRVVHWINAGRLPAALWGLGAWLDARTCSWRPDRADYLECLIVARKPGGSEVRYESRGLLSLFVPRRWLG
jgi:SAM-dependent methyltransferase